MRDVSDDRWNEILTSLLCTKTKASFANLPSRLLQRRQPAARWRLVTCESLGCHGDKYCKEMKCITNRLQKHLACVLHWSVKVKHFPAYILVCRPTMLQRSVPYLGDFPPYGRSSWTLRHFSAEMSRPKDRSVRAYGSNHLSTRTEMSQCRHRYWTGAEMSRIRTVLCPMCLKAR